MDIFRSWWAVLITHQREFICLNVLLVFCHLLCCWVLVKQKSRRLGLLSLLLGICFAALLVFTPYGRLYWVNGWGWHDYFVLLVMLGGICLLVASLYWQKKRFSLVYLVFFVGLYPFIMLVYFGIGRSVTIDAEPVEYSQAVMTDTTFVQQIEKTTPNGSSNGVSYSSPTNLLVGIDRQTGTYRWSRPRQGLEYLIGSLDNRLLLVNEKKRSVYWVSSATGKRVQTMDQILAVFPKLKGILSFQHNDYLILGNHEWALFGTDNHYYRMNSVEKTLKQEDTLKKEFTQKQRVNSQQMDQEMAFQTLIEPQRIATLADGSQLISYKKSRDASDLWLGLWHNQKWQWQVALANRAPSYQTGANVLLARQIDQRLWLNYRGQIVVLHEATGKVAWRYDLKWNQRGIEESTPFAKKTSIF